MSCTNTKATPESKPRTVSAIGFGGSMRAVFGMTFGSDGHSNTRKAVKSDDEKHVHPLQLDVIERACVLWSNPGEVVFTPFMGVGSEVYGAVLNGRKGIGAELKTAYYNQSRTMRNKN
jgi:hypothetical protein